MAVECTLAEDINKCPFYDRENGLCDGGPDVCGFLVKRNVEKPMKYNRQPRWFERYTMK